MRVKLEVKFFDREDDLVTLNGWLKAREHKELEISSLPPIGFMAFHEETPIAACFLRRAEGGLGILDGLATNPEANSALRHVAIEMVVNMIIEQAKVRNVATLIAWSKDTGTLARAYSRHGFRQLPDTMIAKDLTATLATH